jgi:hypothetical protein
MSKNYVAKTTIDFSNLNFYVRPGDILVHDPVNKNTLTIYRDGEIVKTGKQEPLGIAAFLKNGYIQEISPQLLKTLRTTKPAGKTQARSLPVEASAAKAEPKKQAFKASAPSSKKSDPERKEETSNLSN